MSKLTKIIYVSIFLYGFPMVVSSIPYYIISKTDIYGAIFVSIITYILTFIIDAYSFNKDINEYLDDK